MNYIDRWNRATASGITVKASRSYGEYIVIARERIGTDERGFPVYKVLGRGVGGALWPEAINAALLDAGVA